MSAGALGADEGWCWGEGGGLYRYWSAYWMLRGCYEAVQEPVRMRLVKALPPFDPQQMSALGENTYGGPLLQAMLRAAALDE